MELGGNDAWNDIYLSFFYMYIYNVQFRPYSTKSKSHMPIRIRSRQPFGVRCCQLTSQQQQTSRAEPGSTKCFVCGTTSGTTSERRPDARATLQPCSAPQGLAAKLSSKRHHHLLACGCAGLMLAFIHGKMNFWNCDGACACGHFMPLPDLWGAPERPSTVSTGGSSQACAKLYACDVWNDVKTTSCCEEQPVFGDSTTRPGSTCGSATTGTICCTFKTASKHAAQCNLLGRSAGLQAGTSRVTNMGGSAQTMSGLEGQLSCMWNDVKATSRCRDFSARQ